MTIKPFLFIGSNNVIDFMNTQFSPYDEIVENFETYSDMEEWFFEVKLMDKKNILSNKEKDKYYKEIISFRNLLRDNLKKYLENKSSINKILQRTNEILVKSQVHPRIQYENSIFECYVI